MLKCAPLRRLVVALAALTGCLFAAAGASAQESARSTRDGVFSQGQVKRGEETFERICANCHTTEQFGESFIDAWVGATVGDLFDLVSSLMPDDQPGSLEPEEYVAVLSYIFKINGSPLGPTPLEEQREVLGRVRIED